jgi:tripartite-type tricarboxylate transporter receptor subunit TctC
MPGVPTIASFGFPGYQAYSWFGVWGPKNMPPDLAAQVRNQIVRALAAPELKNEFAKAAFEVTVSDSPDEFATYFKSAIQTDKVIEQ